MKRIIHVVGARPNFMKAAPVMRAVRESGVAEQTLVHTGQHYDAAMSEIFFRQLELPEPDVNLEVGSGSHAVQTARIMTRFEEVVIKERPDLVLVYGDVNSTVASALVCSKLGTPVGHVEAGLRSFDRTMPEEINRLLTDQIADLLFTPSVDGDENLKREGIAEDKIHRVGNVMIDTLVRLLPRTDAIETPASPYILVTLHRPSNVDDPERLAAILDCLNVVARDARVVFPVHPRTRRAMESADRPTDASPGLTLCDPVGYIEFLAWQRRAALVITDSGGIQEETTYLGAPCLTLRSNTERPVTVTIGTNLLLGDDLERLKVEVRRILAGEGKQGRIPELWDGRAAERIAAILAG